MIIFEQGEQGFIHIDGTTVSDTVAVSVKEWQVWFRTHRGLHKTLKSALADAEALGMPVEMIRPVTVAVGDNGIYEEVHR